MSNANKLNLTIDQGETFTRTLVISLTDGTPVDITTDTFAGQIRTTYTSSVIAKEFECTIIDGPMGQLAISLTATDTSELKARVPYVYDIERTSIVGVARLLWGNIKVTPEVTK
jgi:hypothetical protein